MIEATVEKIFEVELDVYRVSVCTSFTITTGYLMPPTPDALPLQSSLRSSFHDFATFAYHLSDILVLMRQQSERIRNIAPLPLTLGPL